MQVRVVIQTVQHPVHGLAHAQLVDGPHVEGLDAHLADHPLFMLIHRADAHVTHAFGFDGRCLARHGNQLVRPEAQQVGHRNAVDIATGRGVRRIDVGVGVQPQHPQLFALRSRMARHRADRTGCQMVVAPQHDGHAARLKLCPHGVVHGLRPENGLRQIAQTRRLRITRATRIDRARKVARVQHVQPQGGQRRPQLGNPQCIRPHGRAQEACACVGGGADEGDFEGWGGGGGHGKL